MFLSMNFLIPLLISFSTKTDRSSGTSRDWAKGIPNIRYVYTIELKDKGKHGFLLPPDEIYRTGEEIWTGLEAMFLHIIQKNNKEYTTE